MLLALHGFNVIEETNRGAALEVILGLRRPLSILRRQVRDGKPQCDRQKKSPHPSLGGLCMRGCNELASSRAISVTTTITIDGQWFIDHPMYNYPCNPVNQQAEAAETF